eukprot:Nitzschia sp. Nitz4//scaffold99_size76975//2200//3393//NITZ4_005562-RA/size76975-processed-gene-0.41-mRNA-1//-1//CDS//3329560808//5719//frame0
MKIGGRRYVPRSNHVHPDSQYVYQEPPGMLNWRLCHWTGFKSRKYSEGCENNFRNPPKFDGSIGILKAASFYSLLALALAVTIFLSVVAFGRRHDIISLAEGETIRLSQLQSYKSLVNVQAQDSENMLAADVYAFDECPSLTGDRTVVEKNQTRYISAGEYQFDFFPALQGSTLNYEIVVNAGAVYVYLVALPYKELSSMSTLDMGTFVKSRNSAVQFALYLTTSKKLSSSATAYHDVVYALVYESANKRSNLRTQFELDSTSYYLNGESPVCSLADQEDCSIPLERCVILSSSDIFDNSTSSYNDDDASVASAAMSINVTYRRKGSTVAMALMIVLVVATASFYLSYKSSTKETASEENAQEYSRWDTFSPIASIASSPTATEDINKDKSVSAAHP